jgi:ABC-type uncharacterized transport system ATPase subunit
VRKSEIVVELKNITKRFPGIVANDSIDFQLRKGEIHALLGENGAGKSTLMNILFGLYQPDEGNIEMNGKPVVIESSNKAIRLGIGMVHQHFMLVQPFTVTENIIIGQEPTSGFKIDNRAAVRKVRELSDQYGLHVDPNARIEQISIGMQQRVEILKALYRDANILIFDEPTAVLTPPEIKDLLTIMRKLVAEGKSIILITHKLKEIMDISDRVTIIRRGKVVDTLPTSATNPEELAEKMVGRVVHFPQANERALQEDKDILVVKDLVCKNSQGQTLLNRLSFTVRSGEILGIAGVDGNGQSELVEALTGLRKISGGQMKLNGKDLTGLTPRQITNSGLSHIPEDRHKHGLVLNFTVSENMALQSYFRLPFTRRGFINRKEIDRYAERLVTAFDVRTPSIHTVTRSLSGGNQQKAIIAREIDRDPELLIAAQPTRGLDVGAIEFVHEQLLRHRERGKAVVLVSFELDEILNLADRIIVLYEGELVGEVLPHETNDQELGLMMSGGAKRSRKGAGHE